MTRAVNNPFAVGTSVGGTPYFVGRNDIIQNVVSVLRQPLAPGLVLFGQRRIGKSSILRQLEESLCRLGPWMPVFFDLQRHSQATLEEILDDLASTIAAALDLPEPRFGADIEGEFRKSWLPEVLNARPADSRLVLLFDEFDVMADSTANSANRRLFEFLGKIFDDRTLQSRIAAIYAMGRTMEDLDISTGPLFRGIRSEPVSTLSWWDFELLLARGVTAGGIEWGRGVIDAIWRRTAGHPMLTQLIASRAWERAMETGSRRVELAQLDELTQMVLRESHNILNWLWSGLTPACQVVVSAFAEQESRTLTEAELGQLLRLSGVRIMMGQLAEAPRRLRDWDILDEEPTTPRRYRFKVELLRMWVRKHKPFAKVREFIDHVNPAAADDYSRALQEWNTCKRTPEDIDRILRRLELVLDPGRGNPNHVGATELMSELYDAQGNPDRAIQVVERLLPLQTAALLPRYVQLLLTKAEKLVDKEEHEAARQRCFEQILDVAPGTSEAILGLRNIWRAQGRRAHLAGQLADARDLYMKAEEKGLVQELELELLRKRALQVQAQIGELEASERLNEAVALLKEHYDVLQLLLGPTKLEELRRRLEHTRSILSHYTSGLEAVARGDKRQALTKFGHVLALRPEYKQVQVEVARLVASQRSWAHRLALPAASGLAGVLVILTIWLMRPANPATPEEMPASPSVTRSDAPLSVEPESNTTGVLNGASQGTGDKPAPNPDPGEPKSLALDAPKAAPDELPTAVIPGPGPTPLTPAPPKPATPKVKKVPAKPAPKPPESFAQRVARTIETVRKSEALAACFPEATRPLPVVITVAAANGAVDVAASGYRKGTPPHLCVQKVFRGAGFTKGGPGEDDFEAKYVLPH